MKNFVQPFKSHHMSCESHLRIKQPFSSLASIFVSTVFLSSAASFEFLFIFPLHFPHLHGFPLSSPIPNQALSGLQLSQIQCIVCNNARILLPLLTRSAQTLYLSWSHTPQVGLWLCSKICFVKGRVAKKHDEWSQGCLHHSSRNIFLLQLIFSYVYKVATKLSVM